LAAKAAARCRRPRIHHSARAASHADQERACDPPERGVEVGASRGATLGRGVRGKLAIVVLTALVALVMAAGGAANPRAPVFVNCGPPVGSPTLSVVPRQHPRSCTIWGEPPDLANVVLLRRARWLGWGTASALATGRLLNTHPGMGGPSSYPVRVLLFRIRLGCDGQLYYTSAQVAVPGFPSRAPLHVTPACK
jgi:hypothetical protein